MWEAIADAIVDARRRGATEPPVEALEFDGGRRHRRRAARRGVPVDAVISSLPLRTIVGLAGPGARRRGPRPRAGLRYRDFLTVALVLDGEAPFPDNWIYVHEPAVRVARIQNYGAWSPWMVPDPGRRASGSSTSASRATSSGRPTTRSSSSWRRPSSRRWGSSRPRAVTNGYVVRVPQGLSDVRRATTPTASRVIRGWLEGIAEPAAGRSQRPPPLQQLRPLDADRDPGGREPPRRRAPRSLGVNADSVYHEEGEAEEQPYLRAPQTPAKSSPLRS